MKFTAGTPCAWESLQNIGKFFYGRVVSMHPGEILNTGRAVVRDRNFKKLICVRISRLCEVNDRNIDTSPRPLLIS